MQIAIDTIVEQPHLLKNLGRTGLIVNQASTTSTFIPTVNVILQATKKTTGTKLCAIFGPQHGYFQTEQDNMKETKDSVFILSDKKKVPLYSLYSKTREPLKEQLKNIDTLVVDLKDVGCRVYTYMLTLAGCLRSAAKYGKKIVVLDRPNPLGLCVKDKNIWRRVEGNCLDTKWHSFVGWYSIPLRHGLSMGELGHFFIKAEDFDVDYRVIPVRGLKRATPLKKIRQENWVMPSPNLPSWHSSYFFPAFVCLEGTNVSEGRGTTIPFELVGAPWLNSKKCIEFLKAHESLFVLAPAIRGVAPAVLTARPHTFRPTFNKYAGKVCEGVHFGVLDPDRVNLFALGMTFLAYCSLEHKNDFEWSTQEYEYNFKDLPINLILGTDKWEKIFSSLQKNCHTLKEMLNSSHQEAQNFIKQNQGILIYK